MARSFLRMVPALGMAILLLLTAAARAEPVTVRAAPHDGYGRIVFNWPSPVPYSAEATDAGIVVRFGRPIEADLGGAVRVLGTYLKAGTIGSDGRSVTFIPAGRFSVRAFDLGNAVVVDLMEEGLPPLAKAPPPSAPPAAAPPRTPATATAAPLGVRVGEHENYSRVVFDWTRPVGYTLDHDAGVATLVFDRSATLDLGPLKTRPPRFVEGAQSAQADGKLTVTLRTPADSRIRHFRSGPKVVVDVMAPGPATAPKAAAAPAAAPVPPPAPPVEAASAPPPPAAAPPAVAAVVAEPTALTPPPREPVAAPKGVLSPPPVAGRPTPLVPVTPAALPAPDEPPPPVVGKPIGTGPVTPLAAPTPLTAPHLLAPPPGRDAPSGPPPGAVSLRFDWDEPVAAAVFRRADVLWVIFDRPKAVDLTAVRAQAGSVIRGVEQVPIERAAVLRMDTVAGVHPSVRRDGLAWILDFAKQPFEPLTPIQALAQPTQPAGGRIFLPVPEPGAALAIDDPEVGDTLVVVPVIPLGHGIGAAYEYPELGILPSVQGVVVRPAIDTLQVRALRQGVELASPAGLHVTPVSAEIAANGTLTGGTAATTVFDFDRWRRTDPLTFEPTRQELLKAAAEAKEVAKEKARLDLATFFLANGFAVEALGVLDVMASTRPAVAEEALFQATRGAANLLMDRLTGAEEAWYHPSLNNNDEATFWRALLAARKGDAVQASRVLRQLGSVIRSYPDPLKVPLGMTVARTAVDVGDTRQATHFLELLAVEKPTPAQRGQMAYIEGRVAEQSGDFETALAKWEEAEQGPHLPSRAKAAVARTELLLKLEKITPSEAIAAFEKLRFVWRGDAFEFALLRRLGRLYLTEGDSRNGLRTLRQAATYFRDHPDSAIVTQEMTDAFAKLFLEGGADAMPPVSAIALYDEFKELTPAGAKGDEMIRKLADRLVSVDLLERGAELLESQIEFRLQGTEKAMVGAQLALVRIMGNDPERALGALSASESTGLPADLATGRRHLRARANLLLGQSDAALALLDKDDSPEAERIRADIYWGKQDWANSAQVLGRQLRAAGIGPGQPLDDRQGLAVLKLTIALALSGNERGLARARTDYGPLMAQTPYADAFRLIASPTETGVIDYQTVAGKVKEAENFQSFMADYRDRLKTSKLSELFAVAQPGPTG